MGAARVEKMAEVGEEGSSRPVLHGFCRSGGSASWRKKTARLEGDKAGEGSSGPIFFIQHVGSERNRIGAGRGGVDILMRGELSGAWIISTEKKISGEGDELGWR
jgi:hypothetical protein